MGVRPSRPQLAFGIFAFAQHPNESLSAAQSTSHKEAKISGYVLSLHCSWDLGTWLRTRQSDPPTPGAGKEAGIRQNALGNHSGNCWSRCLQVFLLVNVVPAALLRPEGHWGQECDLPSVCQAKIIAPSAGSGLWLGGRLLTPWILKPRSHAILEILSNLLSRYQILFLFKSSRTGTHCLPLRHLPENTECGTNGGQRGQSM